MKPQQFGLTDQERDEKKKASHARISFAALLCILCLAGAIEKLL